MRNKNKDDGRFSEISFMELIDKNLRETEIDQKQQHNLTADDTLLQVNSVEKMTKSKILVESMIMNSYIYIHSDNTRLMSAKRTLCGFNIYDLRTNKLIAQLKANIFGTKYMMENSESDQNLRKLNDVAEKTYLPLNSLPSLEVIYDVKFLKRDRPRSFSIKLGKLQLQNKQPIFNPESNSYSLNFSGRVTVASVKNFQVIHPLDPTFITLTFGKEGFDAYILDFTHPWNSLQAFCVALTALDHKLGFE
ncbi:Tulp3 [Nucleospora cyclopteri]